MQATSPGGALRRFLPVLLVLPAAPAAAQHKPPLAPADYGRFETLGAPSLSPDGRWVAHTLNRVNEERELHFRPTSGDSAIVLPWASAPAFSADSRFAAWAVGVSLDEQKKLEAEKKPVRLGAAVRDLRAGTERRYEQVRAFQFSRDARFLALHGYAPETPRGKGADLRVIDLHTGVETSLGNVASYAWSDRGALLAMLIATGTEAANGAHVYDAANGRLHALDASSSSYRHLVWRKDADDLALLRSVTPGDTGKAFTLLAWRNIASRPARSELSHATSPIPDTLHIVEHTVPRWSDDGRHIAFGLQRRPAPPGPRDTTRTVLKNDELPGVQIWHTSDVAMVPAQKVRQTADERRALLAVWTPDARRVIVAGSDVSENAFVLGDWRHALERITSPYAWGTMFGRPYFDLWAIDLATGTRTRIAERKRYSWNSPGGRYTLWFDSAGYWTHDLRTGTRTNITAKLPASFADTTYDTPTDLLPPHGVGGWLENDQAVLLYDQFDVWQVSPDGARATRLTRGAEDATVHRLTPLETGRTSYRADRPLFMTIRGEWNERQGYARVRPGGTAERLRFDDRAVFNFTRADSADVIVFREEARDVSPNLYVTSASFREPRRITDTNPFLGDYAWTRAELVEYSTPDGRRLHGTLLYPANHDPARTYPMIVYAYEILTPQHNYWRSPSERDYYNVTAWTQQGYFVLMPDIVFRARDPGVSLAETMRAAVDRVAGLGLIDRQRVGFVGHSWGGYHATYLAAHTDIFAAAVAGAPLTDFVSFMGQIHWSSGSAEVDHWETGQARMEVPYWEDPEAHHRNSPIHNVHNMTTPLLMAHGDKDGVVEFFQATEFFNFARRAGRQMVLLVYEGENHSFAQKPNQIDYHRRILEWFGHYLKGEKAPAWITDGVPLRALEEEKRRVGERK